MLLLSVYKRNTQEEEGRIKKMLHKAIYAASFYSILFKVLSLGVI
jgi:hypothetical protein